MGMILQLFVQPAAQKFFRTITIEFILIRVSPLESPIVSHDRYEGKRNVPSNLPGKDP
jgi:hypothetical protein